MRARIKKENGKVFLEIPQSIVSQFSDYYEIEVFSLRNQMFIASTIPMKNKVFLDSVGSRKSYGDFYLTSEEQAVISKISRIRFFERTAENVAKTLNSHEKKILDELLNKKIVNLFKSPKYPTGVYNITNKIYFANKHQKGFTQKNVSFLSKKDLEGSDVNVHSAPALAINTVEHLQKLGYMVLANEAEAKYQMQHIKEKIKDDDVKGVRGFDKKYYILRKSFLREFEQPISGVLEQGVSNASDMSKKLNLTPEAITVILMVMADEGLVIEKRKGEWAKA